MQNPRQFRKAQTPFSVAVAGVISTNPGVTMGNDFDAASEQWRDQRPLLALVGVVPVKVSAENSAIHPGDLLTPSNTAGHAMKADPVDVGSVQIYRHGTIISKALESLDEGTGVIRVLIALH